jgi:hypothetical protein
MMPIHPQFQLDTRKPAKKTARAWTTPTGVIVEPSGGHSPAGMPLFVCPCCSRNVTRETVNTHLGISVPSKRPRVEVAQAAPEPAAVAATADTERLTAQLEENLTENLQSEERRQLVCEGELDLESLEIGCYRVCGRHSKRKHELTKIFEGLPEKLYRGMA